MLHWYLVVALGFFPGCDSEPVETRETCTDGIQNQDETGIDCGGKCIECFDCFSVYCSYLSGGIFSDPTQSLTWKCTQLDGEVFEPDYGDVTQVLLAAQRYKFENKGKLNFKSTGVDRDGRWEFDDPGDPKRIYYNFPDTIYNFYLDVVSIKEDELVLFWYEDAIATFEPE